ncbi:apoptosis-associated speck-like protein containing a CARD [Centroberyx affinis]|uniref:apoptosis-associated speck-like protein containing a CARD n=1 Tax=Centroberyx affinis TaxID=166261 RepID=UPI003A5BB888
MATSKELLLETLEDLREEEFKSFKWFLNQADILEGFPAMRRSRLERADRMDTVDQMMQIYSQHSPEVTMKVLMKINRNDLAQFLSNTSSGPKDEDVTVLFSKADILERFPEMPRAPLERADRQDTVDLTAHIYSEQHPEVNMKVLIKINRNDLQLLSNTSSGPKALGSSAGASGVGTTVREEHFVDKHRDELIQKVRMVATILDKLLTKKVIKQEGYNKVSSKSTTQDQMRELYNLLNAKKGKDIFYDILEQEENLLIDELKELSFF